MKTQMANIQRRSFLKLMAGSLAWWGGGTRGSAHSSYRVGVGRSGDPYEATLRAVAASGEWPAGSLLGRAVVIKPNLVSRFTAETGITTDPQVVRALVDLSLRDGAGMVFIIEGGPYGAPFSQCGYGFFETYDPDNRVQLVDLNGEPERLVDVTSGLAYGKIWLPEIVLGSDVFFISAAKMKTHALALATLSLKNLFGLPLCDRYETYYSKGRFAMHERGVHQVVSDLSSVLPIDFSVVDGIWAMEGDGPINGHPVQMNTVVSGKNALAVDRVCLETMGLPQGSVQHLNYATRMGKGPSDLADIQILGDSLTPRPFVVPELPPVLECPWVFPRFFSPREGQFTNILYWMGFHAAWVRVRIVQGSPQSTELTHVRTLHDWTVRTPGIYFTQWDGKDDNGQLVGGPAFYSLQIQAKRCDFPGREAYTVGWIHVNS